MIIDLLARIIDLIVNVLVLLIFIWALLSWFVSPYNPVRSFLDRLVEPMLAPIRARLPPLGGFDLSPLVLILLLLGIDAVLQRILYIL
jgi:YggT family protein